MNNFKLFARIWFWIAVACCVLSTLVMAATFYIEHITQCTANPRYNEKMNSDVYAALLGSVFMVFFFAVARTEDSIAKVNAALNSGYQHIRVIHDRVPITGAHATVHLPFIMFCALTLAAPGVALLTLRSIVKLCGPQH
jgi:hypothetical protein